MKRQCLIFLFLMAVGSLMSSAQSPPPLWNSTKSTEGVSLRGMVGLNLSQFIHVERWNGIKAGVNVGVMAEKPILASLSAKAGIFYTMKGTVGHNDAGFGGKLTTTFSPSYLEIPILASYRYQVTEGIRLQFDFGPYFAIGLHGKDVKKNSGNGSYSKPTKVSYDVFDQLKRFDFGFRLGPEVVFGNRLAVGIGYEISAINISKMGGKVGNSNLMINLSYSFYSF